MTSNNFEINEGTTMSETLNFFITLFPDEDFRSVVFRWHRLSGNRKIVDTNNKLFGTMNGLIPSITKNIGSAISGILGKTSVNFQDFLNSYTFFPIYRLFFDSLGLERLTNYFNNGDGGVEKNTAIDFLSSNIHYCFECLQEDYKNFGQCYVHRIHQFKQINICKKHQKLLNDRCPRCSTLLAAENACIQLYKPSCLNCDFLLEETQTLEINERVKVMLNITEDLEFLLSTKSSLNSDILKELYHSYSLKKRYLRFSGTYRHKEFINDFNKRPEAILFGLNIHNSNNTNLISDVLKIKKRYSNLYLHIVIIRMFSGSIREFLQQDPPLISCNVPFGYGPWECKNSFCSEQNQKVIRMIKRIFEKKTDQLVGIFECPMCKMIYKQYENLEGHTKSDDFNVIHFGDVWKAKIIEMFQEDKGMVEEKYGVNYIAYKYYRKTIGKDEQSTYEFEWFENMIQLYFNFKDYNIVAKQLGVTTPKIKRFVEYYFENNSDIEAFKKLKICAEYLQTKIDEIKENILSFLEQHSNIEKAKLNRTKIINNIGYWNYKLLITHDPHWVNQIIPVTSQLDWSQRDNELHDIVVKRAEYLYESNPNDRIKKETLLKILSKVNRRHLEMYPERFPKTFMVIEENLETIEDYQLRKIKLVIADWESKPRNLTLGTMLNMHVFRKCSDRVRYELEKCLLLSKSE